MAKKYRVRVTKDVRVDDPNLKAKRNFPAGWSGLVVKKVFDQIKAKKAGYEDNLVPLGDDGDLVSDAEAKAKTILEDAETAAAKIKSDSASDVETIKDTAVTDATTKAQDIIAAAETKAQGIIADAQTAAGKAKEECDKDVAAIKQGAKDEADAFLKQVKGPDAPETSEPEAVKKPATKTVKQPTDNS